VIVMPSHWLTPELIVQFSLLFASKTAISPAAGARPSDQLEPVFQLWSEVESAFQELATDGTVRSSRISSLGRKLVAKDRGDKPFLRRA
jgi:hypothetical protein